MDATPIQQFDSKEKTSNGKNEMKKEHEQGEENKEVKTEIRIEHKQHGTGRKKEPKDETASKPEM